MTVAPSSRAWRAATDADRDGNLQLQQHDIGVADGIPQRLRVQRRGALAPGATTIMFCPPAPTTTTAAARAPGRVIDAVIPAPLALRWSSNVRPAASSPTAATSVTSAPARAAATAWLPPLPPGSVRTADASTVSPGPGSAATSNTRSELTLPTTQTRAMGQRS